MSLPKCHLHRFISFKYQKKYFVLLYLYRSFINSHLVYRRPDVRWNCFYSLVFNLIEPNYNLKKNNHTLSTFIGINYFNFYMTGAKTGYVWVLCLLFFFFISHFGGYLDCKRPLMHPFDEQRSLNYHIIHTMYI